MDSTRTKNPRIREAQARVKDKVTAAELFLPNARYYGGGPIYETISRLAETRAIRSGGLARQTLWALTADKLYIFRAKYRLLKRRVDLFEVLGAWNRNDISVRQVKEMGNLPREPDYALAFTSPEGQYIEAQAASHSTSARELIEQLTQRPLERLPR